MNYAVIYGDNTGVYGVQLWSVASHPLAELKEKVEKFNNLKQSKNLARWAKVVNDQEIVKAFEFFVRQEKDLNRRMGNVIHAVEKMQDELKSFRPIEEVK